jgi:hypothetical protein
MNYILFENGEDSKSFKDSILTSTLYSSDIEMKNNSEIQITLKVSGGEADEK